MSKKLFIVFAPDMVPARALICNVEEQSESLTFGRFVFGKNQVLLSTGFHTGCPVHDCISGNLSEDVVNNLFDNDYYLLPLDHPIPIGKYLEMMLMEDYCEE